MGENAPTTTNGGKDVITDLPDELFDIYIADGDMLDNNESMEELIYCAMAQGYFDNAIAETNI